MPFFSIHLNSNRPRQIVEFFDNVEMTADRPEDIEILLHIDKGDTAMEEVIAQQSRRFTLRILQTDLVRGYPSLWKPLNPLLEMTHPDVYFIANLFDEIRFETKGWDSIVREFKGIYPDDIFRLRSSQFRFSNYIDFWQNGFMPDSSAFYTRRWLTLSGNWCPCMGPDSFQQCVAFYMYTYDSFSPRQFFRDIAVPNLKFSGEGASVGLEDAARERRQRANHKLWFTLMSHGMQEEAKRRAMLNNAQIIIGERGGERENQVVSDVKRKRYLVCNRLDGRIVEALSYRLSWSRISLTNAWRGIHLNYYCGGGHAALNDSKFRGLRMLINAFLPTIAKLLDQIETFISSWGERWGSLVRRFYHSESLRKYFWFLRAPYRRLLKALGL